MVTAERPELLGWYAMTILVFFHPEPMRIQHHPPRPVVLTPVSITSGGMVLMAIIGHLPNWLGCILLLILCATMLLVSIPTPKRLWNCQACGTCSQLIWVLHQQNRSTLKSWHRLFISIIYHFPTKRTSCWSSPLLSGLNVWALPTVHCHTFHSSIPQW